MTKRITVLGCGLIGKYIAKTLHEMDKYDVLSFDVRPEVLKGLHWTCGLADLSKTEDIKRAIDGADIVVNAVPGHMGFKVLETVISCKKDIVDISFMPEDPMTLNDLAHKNKITVVVDFGFAPGISHMFVGNAYKTMKDCTKTVIYVGGLPLNREDEYKAVFSPVDVLEEYTRPARYRENGTLKIETPFEHVYPYFDLKHQRYDAFISDGLRTLLSIPIDQVEYTLRYPKHFKKIQNLKEDGFLDPIHLTNTAKVLIDKWKLGKDDKDFSLLEVRSYGPSGSRRDLLYDEHDGVNHSMARTTGLPAVAMVTLLADEKINYAGIITPESMGTNIVQFDYILDFLREHGIIITRS